jgi:hypothetical protein
MLPTSHAPTAVRRRPFAVVCRGALGLALLGLLGSSALAQTYYVSNAAPCVAPDGTELAPYCTIGSAMAAHNGPGITIVVKPGVYREQVTVNNSGASGAPFVFQAQGPGVILEGADDFSDPALWVAATGGAWRAASVAAAPNQVFADGARLTPTTLAAGSMPANSFRWVAGEGLYVTLNGDSPALHAALVGKRTHGFSIFGRSFVTVSGFEIQHQEQRGINSGNATSVTSDLNLLHNTVHHTFNYGIVSINVLRTVIDGNKVSYSGFHGIGLTSGTTQSVVCNNESSYNVDPTQRRANGIFLSAAPGNRLFGNSLHHNDDTGLHFSLGSNDCVSYHNRSFLNGDHGFDHLGTTGTHHVNDVAYGNHIDGFSFEGDSPNSSVHNSISVDNGLTTGGNDLWVDLNSSVGFISDHNIFYNTTPQSPIKYITTSYLDLASFQAASGQDTHSKQADPLFAAPATGDFAVVEGSPAIDAAHAGVANWPNADLGGMAPIDDTHVPDSGEGVPTFADIGVFEFVPATDQAPVITCPANFNVVLGQQISFTVTAIDPDGDPITSLTWSTNKPASVTGAQFLVSPDKTSGTFVWTPTVPTNGNVRVTFTAANALSGSDGTNFHFRKKTLDGEVALGEVALSGGAPNPSVGAVEFALTLPEDSDVDWSVYDMQGRRVYSESSAMSAGRHTLRWDGTTLSRQRAGTGLYFVRAKVGGTELTRRIVRY